MWLGLDLGTGSVKARLFSGGGETLRTGRAAYSVDAPREGWSESNPHAWWEAVVHAVCTATAGHGEAVRAIGLSGQMHGVVLADGDGRALRPAVLWSDTRSAHQLDAFRALSENLLRSLANPPVTGMAGPTLLWLEAHEPDVYARAVWALQPKDWLRFQLVGEAATDPSDASATLLYDVPGDAWHDEVIETIGLRRDLLPPVRSSSEAAGVLRADVAAELGLRAGIPVATGAGDTAAALHGSALDVGDVQVTVGTGGQCVHLVAAPRTSPERGVHLFRAAADTGWYRMGAIQNAGLALEWVRGILELSWDEMHDALDAAPAGCGGLVFLPYVTGERTPHLNPDARAGWLHASRRHGADAFARAAFEGVAFAFADAFDALFEGGPRPSEALLAGGGSVAPAWRQLLADALQVTLRPSDVQDASVRGAAMLAAACRGEQDAFPVRSGRSGTVIVEPREPSTDLERARRAFSEAYARLYADRR